jgi:hypothetical protein
MDLVIILLFSAMLLQITSFVLWAMKIRPYLKENGLSTLRGINHLATVLNDVQQIIELSKNTNKKPKFLKAFFILESISLLLFFSSVYISRH